MSEHRELVLRASLPRALWTVAWPLIVSNELTIASLGVLLFWLGHLIGQDGLTVQSLFGPFALMVAWLFSAVPVGSSVLVSRSVGANDGRGLTITAGSCVFAIVMWVGIAALVVPLAGPLTELLASGTPVTSPMRSYALGWVLVALPATALVDTLLENANATGDTRFNIVRVLADLAVMAAITPLLMTAGLGIAGAPVAQGLSAFALAAVLWFVLRRRRHELRLGELRGRGEWLSARLWKDIAAIGLPAQIGRASMWASQLVLVRLVAHDGAATVAGFGIADTLTIFGALATMALAQGGGILIGQALGAEQHDRARRAVWTTLVAGWVVMAVFAAATVFDRPFIRLFTSDRAIVEATHDALSILRWGLFGGSAWQCMLAAFAAYRTTLRAALLMLLGDAVGLAVAFAWPGSHLHAVCVSFVAANVLKSIMLLVLFARSQGTHPSGDVPLVG